MSAILGNMQPKKLENYKYFGVIAWILCIGFAIFVYSLVLELKEAALNLQNTSVDFGSRLENVEQIVESRKVQE
ncbi:MAG: hypothetical protein Q7T50_02115 [Candidatus Magasanikbacteria bacterium]|nr:hypothetical protein [Candidatus Magasanikbacteria bacterium]